jgi:cell division transport system permease protein
VSRFRLLVAEAVRSIGANLSTTVAATLTVVIGMFLLGLSIGLGSWMLSWSNHTKKGLVDHVYFCSSATCEQNRTQGDIAKAQQFIQGLQSQGIVSSYKWVPKEVAWERVRHEGIYKKASDAGIGNPLPDEYQVTPSSANQVKPVATKLRDAVDAGQLTGVQEVKYGGKFADQVLAAAKAIEIAFTVIVLILLAASAALIQNTIRLSIFSRRREIEVMKLVGASNWFVRGPFMIEGLIVGAGGAFLAVLLLIVGKNVALDRFIHADAGTPGVQAWSFFLTAALLLLAGLILGVAGTGITLRRYLRI